MGTTSRIVLHPHDVVLARFESVEINYPESATVPASNGAVHHLARIVSAAFSSKGEGEFSEGRTGVQVRVVGVYEVAQALARARVSD
jgi:hypothetical protein